jgi:hypothetical protein
MKKINKITVIGAVMFFSITAFAAVNCFDILSCASGNWVESCVPLPSSVTVGTPEGERDAQNGYVPLTSIECGMEVDYGSPTTKGCGGPSVQAACQ